jgi:hypothetical protein
MKMIIAKLRIAAIISFILYFILIFVGASGTYRFQFDWVQNVLLLVSFVLFGLNVILQVYRFLSGYYLNDEA